MKTNSIIEVCILYSRVLKAYNAGRIKFSDHPSFRPMIVCCIDDVSFDFLDTCETTSELLNTTDIKGLCKKITRNLVAIKKYRPELIELLKE